MFVPYIILLFQSTVGAYFNDYSTLPVTWKVRHRGVHGDQLKSGPIRNVANIPYGPTATFVAGFVCGALPDLELFFR